MHTSHLKRTRRAPRAGNVLTAAVVLTLSVTFASGSPASAAQGDESTTETSTLAPAEPFLQPVTEFTQTIPADGADRASQRVVGRGRDPAGHRARNSRS